MRAIILVGCCCLLGVAGGWGAQPRTLVSMKNGSSITYQLVHPLHEMKSTSNDGVLHIQVDPEKKEIKSVSALVDVMSFDSGNSNRDSHAMEVIDAIDYPDVSFASSAITQHGDSLSVSGKLTFHGITKNIVSSGAMKWGLDTLMIDARFGITLSEFSIERPSLLMIPVKDTLLFSLTANFALK